MPASKLAAARAQAMATSHIFRIMFVNQGKVYEVYARKVSHGELFGFIEVEELLFGERSSVVLDPAEERIKGEFSDVKRTFLPLHAILRIDEVKKHGGGQDHRDGRRQRHGGTVPGADIFDAARREEVKQPSGILGIAGTAALSPFRGAKLLERLRAIEPAVTALDSRFMHFVECTRALTAGERAVLLALLTYGPRPQAPPPAGEGAANRVLVVPRAGTISPWSSKATDIARVCGLEPVRRIERGIA